VKIKMMLLFLILVSSLSGNNIHKYEWNTQKKDFEKKYSLIELNIDGLSDNILQYINEDYSKRFKIYLLDGDKYHEYGGKKFNIFLGFYDEKLHYIAYVTEEFEKSKNPQFDDVMNFIESYSKIFSINTDNMWWGIKSNIIKEYSMVGRIVKDSNYYEIQIPRNRDYLQYSLFIMDHQFFQKIILKSDIKKLVNNEEIFLRRFPEEIKE